MTKRFAILVGALIAVAASQVSYAADTPAAGSDCEAKAVSKAGKPLAGAAKASFVKKCETDGKKAAATTDCEGKAVGKNGKPLAGAAKNSFMKKCVADATAGK